MDGRPPGDRQVPALLRGLRPCPRRRAAVRPAPAAIPDVRRTRPRCPVPRTPLGSGPGRRSLRTSAVQMCDRGRGLRTPATRRRPVLWTPAASAGQADTAAAACWTARQRNPPLPLACPAGNGTARCGIGQHHHGQTARSVAWGGRKASVVLERQRSPGSRPVKVGEGNARWNVDRVVDRARQAERSRPPG